MGLLRWLRRRKRREVSETHDTTRVRRLRRKVTILRPVSVRKRYRYTLNIAIANQKGGVGKTTTTVNLSSILAFMGHRVLLVDMDSQGHSTSGLGIEKSRLDITTCDVLLGASDAEDAIMRTPINGLDLLPANISLSSASLELSKHPDASTRIREALLPLQNSYDYVFFDTPPSLGPLTLNSLVAADTVLVPLQCEYFALEGVKDLLNIVKMVKDKANHGLELEGILLTMYEPTSHSREIAREVRNFFGDKVFRNVIPRDPKIAEAPSHGAPIILIDQRTPGCQAYIRVAKEILASR